MRIWFDTEFIEDGKTIDLISIGMVREDGATLYIENSECDFMRASPWVLENVIPKLTGRAASVPKWRIAQCVKEFAGTRPEFWAYYADYDWVALCQLYGTMMDLPKGWPMFCLDLKQSAHLLGNPKLPEQKNGEHNALDDALWTKAAWEFLGTLADATSKNPPSKPREGQDMSEIFSTKTTQNATHSCGCVGPQRGEPYCPCRMRGIIQRDGRWIEPERDLGPVQHHGIGPLISRPTPPPIPEDDEMSGWGILFLATGTLSIVGSLYHAGFMRGLSHAWRGLEGCNQQAADCKGEARSAIWRAFIVAGVTAILVAWVEGFRP